MSLRRRVVLFFRSFKGSGNVVYYIPHPKLCTLNAEAKASKPESKANNLKTLRVSLKPKFLKRLDPSPKP